MIYTNNISIIPLYINKYIFKHYMRVYIYIYMHVYLVATVYIMSVFSQWAGGLAGNYKTFPISWIPSIFWIRAVSTSGSTLSAVVQGCLNQNQRKSAMRTLPPKLRRPAPSDCVFSHLTQWDIHMTWFFVGSNIEYIISRNILCIFVTNSPVVYYASL